MVKKKKKVKEHKNVYDPILNTDSMWNRETSIKKTKDGKTIQQMLGIDDEDEPGITEKEPMKMMDIVLKAWDKEEEDDDEKNE